MIRLAITQIIQKSRNNFNKFSHQCYYSKQSETKLSYINTLNGKCPFLIETVGQVLDQAAEKYGNKEAIVFYQDNIRKTFAEFNADVDKFAAGLVAIGLQKGDRIGIWSPNYYEWIVTQFATAKAGLILVLINPAFQPRELEYCLNKVGVRAIVAAESFKSQDYYKMLTAVVPSLPDSKPGQIKARLENFTHVIMMSEKKYGGAFSFNEVANCGQYSHFAQLKTLEEEIQFDDPVNIQFTSGTTGFPKGTTLSHFNIINNSYSIGKRLGYDTKPHRVCVPVPLYHGFGCIAASLCTVLFGASQIYPATSYEPKSSYQAVHDEKCTSLYGTPTMFIDILGLPNVQPFNECKTGVMGGAFCPSEVLKGCINKLNMTSICCAYGSTECSPGVSVIHESDSFEKSTTTVGKVLDNIEVKIVDPTSLRIVPVGTKGELWCRGYLIMREYWNDKKKTDEVITKDRWYRTGDLATIDEDSYIKIVGRIKDMIIRGGENIFPTEIESFFHTHPKIAEANVVGVPDERLGEELYAWVRLKIGEKLSEEELRAYCKGKLAHFKIPRYIKFVDKFPMTVTGKVQKFVIREQVTAELKSSEK